MMLGPVLHSTMCTSIELVKRLLERNPMFLPKMNLPMIDVRDAAAAHVSALTIKEVNGGWRSTKQFIKLKPMHNIGKVSVNASILYNL